MVATNQYPHIQSSSLRILFLASDSPESLNVPELHHTGTIGHILPLGMSSLNASRRNIKFECPVSLSCSRYGPINLFSIMPGH
ncbi:hypothetical protein TNCT_43711 [Trichonephila clavata]|uniref:Uncharacterized protein n=1 Tax=Trichonephila clavata TaxID=2740835 RepID=A0A8X6L3T4_TRICU|nr:hypothetical protein TNCT_43711 [Trichonephila clavata]